MYLQYVKCKLKICGIITHAKKRIIKVKTYLQILYECLNRFLGTLKVYMHSNKLCIGTFLLFI